MLLLSCFMSLASLHKYSHCDHPKLKMTSLQPSRVKIQISHAHENGRGPRGQYYSSPKSIKVNMDHNGPKDNDKCQHSWTYESFLNNPPAKSDHFIKILSCVSEAMSIFSHRLKSKNLSKTKLMIRVILHYICAFKSKIEKINLRLNHGLELRVRDHLSEILPKPTLKPKDTTVLL